jgi:hypothetical protein
VAYGDFLDLSEWAARNARFDTSNTEDMVLAGSAVNSAYLATCDSGDPWRFLQREGAWLTTEGGDVYDFASITTAMGITGGEIGDILSIVNDTTGLPLESMSWEALEDYSYSTQDDASSEPVYWSRWDERVRLWPIPQAEYTMGCMTRLVPTEMSADADEPLIPKSWRNRLLVPYASAILLRTEGGLEAAAEAQRHMDEYDKAFMGFRAAYGTSGKPNFSVSTPGWESSGSGTPYDPRRSPGW